MPPRGTTGRSLSTKDLTPGSSEQRAYEAKRDRAFKAALRSEAEGKASPVAKKSVSYGGQQSIAQTRALRSASVPRSMRSPYYMTNPTVTRPQSMSVAERMNIRNKILSGAYKRHSDIPAMPAATGEESITVKKTAATTRKPSAPAAKKAAPIRTTVDMRTTPAAAKAKAPTRMAVNPRTGSTLGFTTGKTTGSTSFKPGVAAKTRVSLAQQMARNAFNKGGVAGPSRSGGGRSAGPSRSTSAPSRGDVGAGRRGGGR